MCGRIESAKKCGEAEIGGKCANLFSSKSAKVALKKAESRASVLVPAPTGSVAAKPAKSAVEVAPEKCAKSCFDDLERDFDGA